MNIDTARRAFASTVSRCSIGSIPKEEVMANTVPLDSVVREGPSTPLMWLVNDWDSQKLPEEGKVEYDAIVDESKKLVANALNDADTSKLSYRSPGWESLGDGIGSFSLNYAGEGKNQKVNVYVSSAGEVPGGLLFVDTDPSSRPDMAEQWF